VAEEIARRGSAPAVVGPEMRAYYSRRAGEYDDWWAGTGAFGYLDRPGWEDELARVLTLLEALPPARYLDVGCGTGFLTRHLPGRVVALDQSAEMISVAAARLPHAMVLLGEAVPLPFRDDCFDAVFTSHFYGHLDAEERTAFLSEARRVAPRLIAIDSALRNGVEPEEWQDRALRDGSVHVVYKRYFTGAGLSHELGGGQVLLDGDWFVAVSASRR
jgi:SAM-dependent methyltransferase